MLQAVESTSWSPSEAVVIDLRRVSFVRPYGAMQLLRCCEAIAAATGNPVEVRGLQTSVHAYLRRINFCVVATGSAVIEDEFDEANEYARSRASLSVQELMRIASDDDLATALRHARRILTSSLDLSAADSHLVLGLISEACSNVVCHSGTTGWMLAQKYGRNAAGAVDVELAIGDGGVGIRRSLMNVHGDVAEKESGFILAAVNGLSSRGRSAHGQGLPYMLSTAAVSGGYLFVRSGQGRVLAANKYPEPLDGLARHGGTQVAMRFRRFLP
jgi:hypothetical protein